MNLKNIETDRRGFTPKLALDFSSLIEKQAKPVYERMGLMIPVITSSTVVFFIEHKTASLLDIARYLDIPHQLASQRVKALLKRNVICAYKDTSDKRKTNYQLTEFGIEQGNILMDYLDKADFVFEELNNELGLDLKSLLTLLNKSFEITTLEQRVFRGE
ncbi:hypothetical protein [Litorilituus lipolyticus]|uniref:MarR family transcriptional regulator n=1 Tax=Litorilituus lipolyticus TaxID=2491017 RepID=A0A502KQF9_9GAMM|nr:hypothetical protein [Litorilituus lipolyticus]TPH13980.1 hypothetical protein EPA86_12775 [Litorilituus lipolyticus]